MRSIALLLLLAACPKSSSNEKAAPPPSKSAIRVPPNPPAVATIAFECSHSDQPFGEGYQSWSTVYDLDAATWTADSADTPGTPQAQAPEPPGNPPGDPTKREHKTGTMPAEKVAQVRAAVAKVLAGGPYEPEYPVSEGISCHLALAASGAKPFFLIDKAKREQKDAVNDLLNAL